MKSEYPDPSPEPEDSHDTPYHDPLVLSQGPYQLPASYPATPYHHPPPTMAEPHWFYDSSMGPWQNFFASFEAYTQYEQARRAYILETEMAPPQAQHMRYAGPPLPLGHSTVAYNYEVRRQMLPAPPVLNPLSQQSAYQDPIRDQTLHHNPPSTFGPESAYEQVFRSSMSPYPDPTANPQFIHEQGISSFSQRRSGPPLDIVNSTPSGFYQHARKPKPPHLKSEANAMAAANDKKRHDDIVARGVPQDNPCGQCRVRMKNHPEHKCYKIETVGPDGVVKRGRCQYCCIRRQKCAVESAEVAMDRMYGHRYGTKEDATMKEEDGKTEKRREVKKAVAHATGDARAYNASFRARDEQDSPYDLTQRSESVPHTPLPAGNPFGAIQRYTQAGPYTQDFISYVANSSPYHPTPSPYAQTPRARTPVHNASYPPGTPLPFGSAAPFPLPGYSDSLSDNVVGAMNQGRRHSEQSIPSSNFVLDPALKEPAAHVATYDHSLQNTQNAENVHGHGEGSYAHRHLPPFLPAPAPAQATMQYNPLNPQVPGYGDPYNEGPRPSQGVMGAPQYDPIFHISANTQSLDHGAQASHPYGRNPLPSLIPPSPSVEMLERMNAPLPYRPDTVEAAPETAVIPSGTAETVAEHASQGPASQGRGMGGTGLRVLPSQPEGRRVSGSGGVQKTRKKGPKRDEGKGKGK